MYNKIFKIKLIVCLLIVSSIIGCKVETENPPTDSFPEPPDFTLSDGFCRVITTPSVTPQPVKPGSVLISFTLHNSHAAHLSCTAWGTMDITYGPCTLINGPFETSKIVNTNLQLGCTSGQDPNNDDTIIFAMCSDTSTGLATIKQIRTLACI